MSLNFTSSLVQALKVSNYDAEPMLKSCGISISSAFTQINGRVLPAPKVIFSCISFLLILLVSISVIPELIL